MADAAAVATPFNSPLETGVRALTVLAESAPAALDLQRLVYFDYLVVHSADAGGPRSLHPNTPLRNGELLVRRAVYIVLAAVMLSPRPDRGGADPDAAGNRRSTRRAWWSRTTSRSSSAPTAPS